MDSVAERAHVGVTPETHARSDVDDVVYVTADCVRVAWPDVQRVLMQDEKVLRHLVVRTDQDLKRAARGKIQPKMPWDKEEKKEDTGASHAS